MLVNTRIFFVRLKDVYTSEDSDEKKPVNQLSSNDRTMWVWWIILIKLKYISFFRRQLKTEVYTSDRSTRSSSTSSDSDVPVKKTMPTLINFLESLSEHIPIQDKHPDAVQCVFFFLFSFVHVYACVILDILHVRVSKISKNDKN